jgi:hypothetical protein
MLLQGHVTQQIDSCYTGAKPQSQLRSPGLRQKFAIPTDQRLNVRASGELWLKHSVEACAYPIIITLSTNGSPDVISGVLSAPLLLAPLSLLSPPTPTLRTVLMPV